MIKVISDKNSSNHLNRWLFPNEKFKVIDFEEFINNPQKADLVYFSGGADVSPYLYGEKTHPTTYSHPKRDMLEMRVYEQARMLDIPIVSICRGSQFVTAMQPGGRLVQNVCGHNLYHTHDIKDLRNNKIVSTTSTHHQMMYPFEIKDYELIAISSKSLSHKYEFGSPKGNELESISKYGEPEIVFYPKSRALAIQGHPEDYGSTEDDFPTYCRELVYEKLL